MKIGFPVLLCTILAACSTTTADLTYSPANPVAQQAAAAIRTVIVLDRRNEDPEYVGAIRGGFGNPLKTLNTAQPVKDEVAAAFQSALQARGLYGAGASKTLSITLQELSGNWVARREGRTVFSLAVIDKSGKVIYQDEQDVLKIEGSLVTLNEGIFASVDQLRAVVMLSLNTAIDQALDKAGFLAAMTSPSV